MLLNQNKLSEVAISLTRVRESPERPDWALLGDLIAAQRHDLRAPVPGAAGLCLVCRGPAGPGSLWCYQCDLHRQCAPGALSDLVVPVAYAVKGGAHARRLWLYKSAGASAGSASAAGSTLLALLLVFLRDHGSCVAGAAGGSAPTHLAVVPTGRSRPGVHPLRSLIAPYLAGPWAELAARPGAEHVRDLDPERFAARPPAGSRVLLLDDTWTTGSSAQSAAMALRLAGARSVTTVVLGRHVARQPGRTGSRDVTGLPYLPEHCAVHTAHGAVSVG
jgi:hypothetical protein